MSPFPTFNSFDPQDFNLCTLQSTSFSIIFIPSG
jgi:hypothetical protein